VTAWGNELLCRCARPEGLFGALLLQRKNQYAEVANYSRRYLAADCQSEWAACTPIIEIL